MQIFNVQSKTDGLSASLSFRYYCWIYFCVDILKYRVGQKYTRSTNSLYVNRSSVILQNYQLLMMI